MKNTDVAEIRNLLFGEHVFYVRWRVTTRCNYQCAFCIQGDPEAHRKQSEGEDRQIRDGICGELVRLLEGSNGYDSVSVSLIGGEVTILPDLPGILERLALCGFPGSIRFDMTTNFSQDSGYYIRLCDIIREGAGSKARSLSIGTSYYSAYTDERLFSEKLRAVHEHAASRKSGTGLPREGQKNPVRLSVGIPMLSDPDLDLLMRMRGALKETDITVDPIFIRNYATSVSAETVNRLLDRTKKRIRVTDKNGRGSMYPNIQALGAALEDADSFCPQGCVCDAGTHSVWIDAFGNAKRCPAIGSTMCMGNLLDGSFRLLDAPQVCTSDHCSCSLFGTIKRNSGALP